MQMTEAQQSEIKQLVDAIKKELAEGYNYDVLPDPSFVEEATAEDVITNLMDALVALQTQPGRQ
jgi:hypothetical protein